MIHTVKQVMIVGVLSSMCFFAAPAAAQLTSPGSIRGKVVFPDGAPITQAVMIRLESLRGVRSSNFTDDQGEFRFPGVPPGIYQVIVEPDKSLFEIATVTVEVFPNAPSILTITLKEKHRSASKKENSSVSATELDNSIPAAAKKEFDRAVMLSKQNKAEESIVHFRKAIELFPKFLMARNDLGAELLSLGKLDEAEDELRSAIALDPSAFNPRLNLGIVLVQQHKFSDASVELKKAVSTEPSSPAARLYLGMALVGLEELDEAERELKTAHKLGGPTYALALFHLGQIYFGRGNREAARQMFESYLLEAPKAENVDEVRKMITLLK